jgi:hypothetical protein
MVTGWPSRSGLSGSCRRISTGSHRLFLDAPGFASRCSEARQKSRLSRSTATAGLHLLADPAQAAFLDRPATPTSSAIPTSATPVDPDQQRRKSVAGSACLLRRCRVPADPIPDKELFRRARDGPAKALPLRQSPGPVNHTAVLDGHLSTSGRRGCIRFCLACPISPARAT